jgi:hypothetical protein
VPVPYWLLDVLVFDLEDDEDGGDMFLRNLG